MEQYRKALNHLQLALDAAMEEQDFRLAANISYAIDQVSKTILLQQVATLSAACVPHA